VRPGADQARVPECLGSAVAARRAKRLDVGEKASDHALVVNERDHARSMVDHQLERCA
jgi:hypothetical protein